MRFRLGCVTQDVLFEIVPFEQDIPQSGIALRFLIRTVVIDERSSSPVDPYSMLGTVGHLTPLTTGLTKRRRAAGHGAATWLAQSGGEVAHVEVCVGYHSSGVR